MSVILGCALAQQTERLFVKFHYKDAPSLEQILRGVFVITAPPTMGSVGTSEEYWHLGLAISEAAR